MLYGRWTKHTMLCTDLGTRHEYDFIPLLFIEEEKQRLKEQGFEYDKTLSEPDFNRYTYVKNNTHGVMFVDLEYEELESTKAQEELYEKIFGRKYEGGTIL